MFECSKEEVMEEMRRIAFKEGFSERNGYIRFVCS